MKNDIKFPSIKTIRFDGVEEKIINRKLDFEKMFAANFHDEAHYGKPEFKIQYARVIRYKGSKINDFESDEGYNLFRKNRTHNITLNNNSIFIENNNSSYAIYIFESAEIALQAFRNLVGNDIKIITK